MDLATQAPQDLAQASTDDLAVGSGGSGGTPDLGKPAGSPGGCGCVVGASATSTTREGTWPEVTLLLLAMAALALRPRRRSS